MRYILLLTLLPLAATAQLKIDSIRITQELMPYSGTDGTGLSSWSRTIIPINDTVVFDESNGIMHYSTSTSMGSVSFAHDSNAQTVHSFTLTTSTGHPDDIQGYSGMNWGFLKDTIVREGRDFRIFLYSEELKPDNFGFSGIDKVRIGPGQYTESTSYSTLPIAGSWVEVTIFGSVPLDVAIPERPLFAVYPNPASQIIIIAGILETQPIRIFDLTGRECDLPRIIAAENETSLDISQLRNGIYWLQAGVQSQKLVVAK